MGHRLALLIATYRYQDTGLRQLASPAHDAEALAAVLRDPEIAGFEVTTLINEPHHRVGEAIGDFYRNPRREDLTLLYFTGHGLKDDDGRLYLAMTNTRRDSLLFTGLSAEQIDQAMEGCRSRQKVLILDCCYSGAFPAGRIAKADTAVNALERFQGRGRTVLTASDATQYSFEGDRAHGQAVQSVFTRYLVDGLRDGSADLDGDGDITVDELYSYVHDRVVEEMPQQRPKKQDNVEGRTVIAQNINWTLPAYLRNAIGSPIATDRLAALDGLAHLHRIGNSTVRGHVREEIHRLTDDDSKQVSATATARLESLFPSPSRPPGRALDTPEPATPPPAARPTEPDRPAPTGPDPVTAPTSPPPSGHVSTADAPVVDVDADPRTSPPATGDTAAADTAARDTAAKDTVARDTAAKDTATAGTAARDTVAGSEPPPGSGSAPVLRSRLPLNTGRARVLAVVAVVVVVAIVVGAVSYLRNTTRTSSGSGSAATVVTASTVLDGYSGEVDRVEFSPDGTILATVGDTGTAKRAWRLWEPATKKFIATLTGVGDAAFSPDGRTLAILKGDGKVRLWDVATRKTRASLPRRHQGAALMAFNPDGTILATAATCACVDGFDNPVQLWDVATGRSVATLVGHTNGVQTMAFGPDGKTLASGAVDKTVRLWDVATRKATFTLTTGWAVRFDPDGTTLATSSPYTDNRVRLWDVTTGKITATLGTGHPLAFLDDTTLAISNSGEDSLQVWNVASGLMTASLPSGVVFSPDGKAYAYATADSIRLWNLATGRPIADLAGHTDRVNDIAFSPDGATLATAGSDKTVRLWPAVR